MKPQATVISLAGGEAKSKEPYPIDSDFELIIVTMACKMPSFFGRIGALLDPECLTQPDAKLALEAAQAIGRELGRGPEKLVQVIQRMRAWMREGRITQDEIEKVSDMFDLAEDEGLLTEDAAVLELAPILKKRVQRQAVQAATAGFNKGDDLEQVTELLAQAARIGISNTSTGTYLGPHSAALASSLRDLERMSSGIGELDEALDGGFIRSSTAVFLAESSGGKSMALVQMATAAARQGLTAAYATLELGEPIVMARLMANTTGIPTNEIMFRKGGAERAGDMLAKIQEEKHGHIALQSFIPQQSTVADILAWVGREEAKLGRIVDVLIVDYGDKVAPPKGSSKEISGYTSALLVYEGLRIWASNNNRWCFTASQANRQKGDKRKKLDMDDVADSMHKVRVVPLVISLNKRGEENEQVLMYVAKNTLGRAGTTVGPMPHAYECARIAPPASGFCR